MFTKKNICGCYPRDGSFAVGIVFLCATVLAFFSTLKIINNFAIENAHLQYDDATGTYIPYHPTMSTEKKVVRIFLLIVVGLIIVQIIANTYLIAGVLKEKLTYLHCWLLTYKILVGLLFAINVVQAFLCYFITHTASFSVAIMLIAFVQLFVTLYCIMIVRAHYKMLKENIMPLTEKPQEA